MLCYVILYVVILDVVDEEAIGLSRVQFMWSTLLSSYIYMLYV